MVTLGFESKVTVSYSHLLPSTIKKLMQQILKGYLHYKIITSQNVSSEPQVNNFFILWKSYVPFSRHLNFSIFNLPMIYQICDVLMSINT